MKLLCADLSDATCATECASALKLDQVVEEGPAKSHVCVYRNPKSYKQPFAR